MSSRLTALHVLHRYHKIDTLELELVKVSGELERAKEAVAQHTDLGAELEKVMKLSRVPHVLGTHCGSLLAWPAASAGGTAAALPQILSRPPPRLKIAIVNRAIAAAATQ